MVIASELKPGMIIRSEGQVYKVLDVESKAGAAKMSGVVKATLSNLHTSRLLEKHFRPQERLEDLELQRHNMEFLYSGEGNSTFMSFRYV
jgi:elongation factor P